MNPFDGDIEPLTNYPDSDWYQEWLERDWQDFCRTYNIKEN